MIDFILNSFISAVSTGDSRNLMLPIVLFVICAISAIAIIIKTIIKK